MALEGATPTKLGPRPLNRALGPSFSTMCRRHWTRPMRGRSGDGRATAVVKLRRPLRGPRGPQVPLLGLAMGGPKWQVDDCSLVFTTSRGHVAMAPVVPATLQKNDRSQRRPTATLLDSPPGH